MQFAEVQRRLRVLPAVLPDPPAALTPVLVDAPGIHLREAGPAAQAAAVLVLLYPSPDGEAHVVLIERPRGDLRHAGEISFPGGAIEAADASPVAAALREAREEVGLDPEQAAVTIVGQLAPVEIRVSGFTLAPVVALASRRPRLEADRREVAAILEVPLRHFLAGAPVEIVETVRDGWRLRYGAYPVGEHRVWGATARVLGQLGAFLAAPAG